MGKKLENEREGDHRSVFQPFIRYGTDTKEANAKMWTLIKVEVGHAEASPFSGKHVSTFLHARI